MSLKDYRLLPNRLQELRKEKQYSQKQLAQAIGVSEAMYSRIESGERAIQPTQIEMVAQYLKADVEELRSLLLADRIKLETHEYSDNEINKAFKVFNKYE